MNIAEVSKKFGLTADTLRYYERIGLLPAVARNKSGNRNYSSIDCERIEFIKCMREAGLSIEVLTFDCRTRQAGKPFAAYAGNAEPPEP